MEVRSLSTKHGIYSFYDGSKYVVYSEYYGVVAESTEIIREDNKTTITFDICEWIGYWDLKSIIAKGIRKLENRYIEKVVLFYFNTKKDEQMHLNKHLQLNIINY